MKDTTLILLAAGASTRFAKQVKKQWLRIEDEPLWSFVAQRFESFDLFEKIIIAANDSEIFYMKKFHNYHFVAGGNTRQQSLKNALQEVSTKYVVVSDVARGCISKEMLLALLEKKEEYDCVVPAISVTDTITYHNETIDREAIKRVQTPQLSKTALLKEALQSETEFTDDSSAIVAHGGKRGYIEGSNDAHKITYAHDLTSLRCLRPPLPDTFSGNGFDVHKFDVTKSSLFLCGVEVACGYGFEAHSDGDVAIHALIDALMGASGMGDIGELFPDNDPTYKGIDSKKLLEDVVTKIYNFGFEIINVDLTIIAQKPKLSSYKEAFRNSLAQILGIKPFRVNIKATTTEKLGFIGRSEGVGVLANANLKFYNWMEN